MSEFTLDMSALKDAMQRSSEAVNKGATNALDEIKDDWIRGAVDVAPYDKHNLERQISGEVVKTGASGIIETTANATSDTGGKRFNYALYIHEYDAGGKSLEQGGTEKKFLDVSMEKRQDEYMSWIEEEVEKELRRLGW